MCMNFSSANTHPVSQKNFRNDIQGLRAVAVGGVVLDHIGFPHLEGGYAGVDVFFVISGFLITDHIVRSLLKDGSLSFGEFYARRARRILPASLLVAIIILCINMFLNPVTIREKTIQDAIATALYIPNYLFAYRATDYFSDKIPSIYQHYWSLGVEEQFYIVWPLILMIAFKFSSRISQPLSTSVRSHKTVLLAVAGAVGILSAWLNWHDLVTQQPSRAFFWATGRAWEFAVGGSVALIADRLPEWWRSGSAIRTALSWLGLGFIAYAFLRFMYRNGNWLTVPPLWAGFSCRFMRL